ncbi:hypothetical protein XENOCAPTIV_007656 [Xenoophorus captivus]|uniref:Uncharacterized protein n=1 Tax=Xenoophorus captivus TaxID=1517983 RepID=A0ABV0QZ47_9TELE
MQFIKDLQEYRENIHLFLLHYIHLSSWIPRKEKPSMKNQCVIALLLVCPTGGRINDNCCLNRWGHNSRGKRWGGRQVTEEVFLDCYSTWQGCRAVLWQDISLKPHHAPLHSAAVFAERLPLADVQPASLCSGVLLGADCP